MFSHSGLKVDKYFFREIDLYISQKFCENTAASLNTGPENLKKFRPKNSNKSISRNLFSPNSIFCKFKNGQKSIFELGKSLKLPKMQFQLIKNLICLISRIVCLDLFKFSGLQFNKFHFFPILAHYGIVFCKIPL